LTVAEEVYTLKIEWKKSKTRPAMFIVSFRNAFNFTSSLRLGHKMKV